jgi:hypothetical protein
MRKRMTLTEFYDFMERFDWNWELSSRSIIDDERYSDSLENLSWNAHLTKEHNSLYNAYFDYILGKGSKPARPKEGYHAHA